MKHSRWILIAGLLLTGFLLLPVLAYVVGGRLAGPYEGSRGLASYLGTIYADVGSGRPLALILVLGPLLSAAIWALRAWLARRMAPPETGN